MGWFGKKARKTAAIKRPIRAKYDAAQTTEDNYKHWAAADSLSANSANSQAVRARLRSRSRYEIANNCYARGILNTISAYTVGTGPTLQLSYRGNEDSAELRQVAQHVERYWQDWAAARHLTQKLSTAQLALDGDGEAFALVTTAAATMKTPVSLDLRLYEADQFDDPAASWVGNDSGVRLDEAGNPAAYSMLFNHPGDAGVYDGMGSRWLPAEQVLHIFRCERPGQLRGIPRTTPALPLFALLRRFTLATVTAAETAADFAAILYNDQPAYESNAEDEPSAWQRIEIERGAMLTAPDGSRISQLKAEHPNATFDEFVRAILREIARCLSVPAVIALGDASNYNYASGRLDLQSFNRQMACDRSQLLESQFLDRIFEQWLDEALLIEGFLPDLFAQSAGSWSVSWRWQEPEHVDRAKEAAGQQTELANNTTTLAREYARRGEDWETELRQRARELQLQRELQLMPETMPRETEVIEDDETEEQPADSGRS